MHTQATDLAAVLEERDRAMVAKDGRIDAEMEQLRAKAAELSALVATRDEVGLGLGIESEWIDGKGREDGCMRRCYPQARPGEAEAVRMLHP